MGWETIEPSTPRGRKHSVTLSLESESICIDKFKQSAQSQEQTHDSESPSTPRPYGAE
jgi:hypothetical protein